MDYKQPYLFYDTFAMRDLNGRRTIAVLYPFFPEGETRKQLLAGQTQAEAKSCWNGMGMLHIYDSSHNSLFECRSISECNLATQISRHLESIVSRKWISRGL
jgi:hypothetical protein